MKKCVLITIVSAVLLLCFGNAFAQEESKADESKVLNADSIIVSVTEANEEISVNKKTNDEATVKTTIAKMLSEHERAVVFNLQAYNKESEETDWNDGVLNVTVSYPNKSGIGSFGKNYRMFKVNDESFDEVELSGNACEFSFETDNIGTFVFVYNYKAFPVSFYSEYDAGNVENNDLFFKTEDLAANDMVYAPSVIPQKDGFVFAGWVDTLRKSVPLTYKNYVDNGTEYCAKWIDEADIQCNMNAATVENIEFSNNNINFDKDKKVYFLDELHDGAITITASNSFQAFRVWANGIDVNFDEDTENPYNPQNITFSVQQDNLSKRIDIEVFSADYTNATIYSFIMGDDTASINTENESVLNGSIKGYRKAIYNADDVVSVNMNEVEPEYLIEGIDAQKNKVLSFKTEPIGEYENLLSYTISDAPEAKMQMSLEKADGTAMGTNYKIYKVSGGRNFEQEICENDEKSVSFYADGFGTFILAYEPNSYDVTFISDGNVYEVINVDKGNNVTLPIQPQKSGYTFRGWYSETDGKGIALSENEIVNEYKIIYAYWQKNSSGGGGTTYYNITFDANNDTKVTSQRVARNSIIKEPTVPIKEGFSFDGWYTDNELTVKYDFAGKVTKAITLYAKWTESKADVQMDNNKIILTIGDKNAKVFGIDRITDVAPIIRSERAMLPVRFVAEALGAKVGWSEKEQKVTIIKDSTVIIIYINSDKAYVNDKEVILDSPAFIENDRTYTPLRFITENLGADVKWDETAQKITIEK